MALIRNHGEAVVGPAGYEDITNMVGFNFRLSEIAAAMASEQLKKLPALNALRTDFVSYLNEGLARYEFLVPPPVCPHGAGCSSCQSTYYVYPLRYLPDALGVRGYVVTDEDGDPKCQMCGRSPLAEVIYA